VNDTLVIEGDAATKAGALDMELCALALTVAEPSATVAAVPIKSLRRDSSNSLVVGIDEFRGSLGKSDGA
jgi:hypothetical protein